MTGLDGFLVDTHTRHGDTLKVLWPAGPARYVVRRMARWCEGLVLLLLASVLALQAAAADEAYPPAELNTEALYLTRLAPFVDWPVDAFSSGESPLVICAVGTDPLARPLARVAHSRGNGKRPIRVRVVGAYDALDKCHILYLGAAGDSAIRFARAVRYRPVLTVARSNGDRNQPAMIIFAVDRGRVRFDIDDAGAARARLAISSKLLALARNVTPAPTSR